MRLSEIREMGAIELSRLSEQEMRNVAKVVQNAVNKRVRNIARSGEHSQAVEALIESGGTISTANKTRNQLYKEVSRGLQFTSLQSSSVAGAKSVRQGRERRAFGKTREESRTPPEIAEKRLKDFYREYRKWEETHRDIIAKAGSPESFKRFSTMYRADENFNREELDKELYDYGEFREL